MKTVNIFQTPGGFDFWVDPGVEFPIDGYETFEEWNEQLIATITDAFKEDGWQVNA